MKAECCQRSRTSRKLARGTVGAGVFAAFVALMPKCPVCMAAWLTALGLSGIAPHVGPRSLWVGGAAVMALAAAAFAHVVMARRAGNTLTKVTAEPNRRQERRS
jgi:predicted transporter